jgi:hypothetical protein
MSASANDYRSRRERSLALFIIRYDHWRAMHLDIETYHDEDQSARLNHP